MKNENTSERGNASIAGRNADEDSLTYAVIGEAMQVHTELGPGLDEVLYHDLLSERLLNKGIVHKSKPREELLHRGLRADLFECDLLFENRLVAELKTLGGPETFAPEHFAQLICYLKFWKVGTGLLLDFGKERLVYRRVAFTDRPKLASEAVSFIEQASAVVPGKEAAQHACDSIIRIFQTHGLGYRDTTYAGLIAADLAAENVPITKEPEAVVWRNGKPFAKAHCRCMVVADKIGLLILALRDKISTTDRAIMQTYLKLLRLEGGLIVNFGKHELGAIFVNPPKANRIKTH